MLSGHISNWELSVFSASIMGFAKANIIVRHQSNSYVNQKINELREKWGNKIIEAGASIRAIYKLLSNNEIICFLIDQSAHSDYSVYSEFFGVKVATYKGPAKLALKYRPEILFSNCKRNNDGTYHITLERIDYDDLQESNNENILKLTDRFNLILEKFIRENPEQWLWFHRRFKHIQK